MKEVKIYTIVSDQLSPPITGESFCTDMVRHSDYAELEAKCAAMVAENAELKSALNDILQPDAAVLERNHRVRALDAMETPATDAFLAEVRAQAHKEGAYFVANRMLAAWDAGFIDDTAKNAADIARMILTSTEFMADAPEGDFDRSFADGVLEGIAAQLRKGVQS
ncbi:ead/Ea22-like family protein [Salmonella enterica]|nr:ead/Ea22-like family protein [Salmonella enterica]ECH6601247.1 ead/Ea22-like family protein [Salmonella enterica]EEG8992830.1 ead/Ea22-like family protein [Salmonella enterica]